MRGRLRKEVVGGARFAAVLDSLAESTKRSWTQDLRTFQSFCEERGLRAFPTAPQTVLEFARHYAQGRKCSTVAGPLAALSYVHRMHGAPDPTKGRDLCDFMFRLRREKPSAHAEPVTTVDLRKMLAHLAGRALLDVRDRAILLVMFFGALPRSLVVSLALDDVTFDADGMFLETNERRVYVGASGDDQVCPVVAMRTYIGVRGDQAGPLFTAMTKRGAFTDVPLHRNYVSNLVHDIAKRAVSDDGRMSSGLRRGFILELASAGVMTSYIMRQSGHKNLQSLAKQTGYVGHPFKMSVESRRLRRSAGLTKRTPGAGL